MQPDTLIRNPTGKPVISRVVIERDAAAVWQVAGQFDGFAAFIPALSTIEMIGTGVGALRLKTFHDGNVVVEQLNSRDEQAMCMTWTTLYNTLGIARLWAALAVETLGDGCCSVTWTIVAEPLEQAAQGFEGFVQGFADSALENLRNLAQGG